MLKNCIKAAVFSWSFCLFAAASFANAQNQPPQQTQMLQNGTQFKLFGLTVDNISDFKVVKTQLEKFKNQQNSNVKTVVRVVFEPNYDATYFANVGKLRNETGVWIMGELLDSYLFNQCVIRDSKEPNAKIKRKDSVKCYRKRAEKYLKELGSVVDIWEIGNEVNGEWTGWRNHPKDKNEFEIIDDSVTAEDMSIMRDTVADMIEAANNVFRDKPRALTFYFNDEDYRRNGTGRFSYPDQEETKKKSKNDETEVAYGRNYSMFKWAEDYKHKLPGLNYIFISYWQDDNWWYGNAQPEQIVPDYNTWANIFLKFKATFDNASPNVGFGFGEVGTKCYFKLNDNTCQPQESEKAEMKCQPQNDHGDSRCGCCLKAQKEYIERYYLTWDEKIPEEMRKIAPGSERSYAGGYFWWYFNYDVINKFTNERIYPKGKDEANETLNKLLDAYRKWNNLPSQHP